MVYAPFARSFPRSGGARDSRREPLLIFAPEIRGKGDDGVGNCQKRSLKKSTKTGAGRGAEASSGKQEGRVQGGQRDGFSAAAWTPVDARQSSTSADCVLIFTGKPDRSRGPLGQVLPDAPRSARVSLSAWRRWRAWPRAPSTA